MKFIKVVCDENQSDGTCRRQAVFYSHYNYYLYSYSKQPSNGVDETAVFGCDSKGGSIDYREHYMANGYVHSSTAMSCVADQLSETRSCQ